MENIFYLELAILVHIIIAIIAYIILEKDKRLRKKYDYLSDYGYGIIIGLSSLLLGEAIVIISIAEWLVYKSVMTIIYFKLNKIASKHKGDKNIQDILKQVKKAIKEN